MKGIKPFKLGMMTRPFQFKRETHFGVSVTAYFPFDPPGSLRGDMELWMEIDDLMDGPPVLDVGIPKSRSEFLVVGHAYQPGGRAAPTCPVKVRVGGIEKTLYVIGDRVWTDSGPTEPRPFERMELSWARAFGGEGYEANPLGRGAAPVQRDDGAEVTPLPNVELPGRLVTSRKDRPPPAGLGRVDFTWPQRMGLAGTYDQRWLDEHFPGFAEDMDWRIWNMASADQQQDAPFVGDEALYFENLHPERPRLEARLPGIRARAFVTKRTPAGELFEEVGLRLTTVWLFPHAECGVLVFQGATPIREDDGTDVLHVLIAGERLGEPRDPEHYRSVLAKRLDPENAIEALNDDDLMPAGLTGLGPAVERVLEMTAPENLREARARAGASAEIEASRAHIESLGLDADEHGAQPLAPAEPVPRLEDLAEFLKEKQAEVAEIERQNAEERRQRDAATEAIFEELGLDYDVIREETSRVQTGPPEFKADENRAMLRKLADDAAAAGTPNDELEYYASDPEYYEKLKLFEARGIEGYRIGAHLQSPAGRRDEEGSAALRAEVERRARAGESFENVDLTGADLAGIDLSGADLSGALMESVDLVGANLSGARFDRVVLAHADLSRAKLRGASFQGANLGRATLRGADSGGEVDLSGAQLWGADLGESALVGARMQGAMLMETNLAGADLTRAVVDGVIFHQNRMAGAVMRSVQARLAIFVEVDASGIDFGGATLAEAVFMKCSARGAIFTNAQMDNFRCVESSAAEADFKGAVLDRANLRGADLREADFSGASLLGADLSEAQAERARFYRIRAAGSMWMRTDLRDAFLVSADLKEAILQKADIRGADLRGSNLYRADFGLVHSDDRTTVEGAIQLKVKYKPVRSPS